MFTLTDHCALIEALYSGDEVELDPDAWFYFYHVLPPIWENQSVSWPDGQAEHAAFGFADHVGMGATGPIIAFYRRYKAANQEKVRQAHRLWRQLHPDKYLRAQHNWRKKNTERLRAIDRKYRVSNIDEVRRRNRRYNRTHRGKRREYERQYYATRPDKMKAKYHKRRAREIGSEGSFTAEEWQALCAKYDYRCLCCSEKKPLTADHIVPLSKGGPNTIENIQPLCRACNSRKGTQTTDYRPGYLARNTGQL